ncbi:NAD(P)-binding protein [Clavulina sp. PMI_390]|nr:NAD(P)-binding protein [Clavulina sp. PMI_390]
MSIPAKCHAIQISKTGGPEVIDFNEIDTPTPKPEEILVKVEWAGVNYIDTYHRGGLYPVQFPFTLGQECTGTIVKLPTSSQVLEDDAYKRRGFQLGDRVAVIIAGSFREYVPSTWSRVFKMPEGIDPRYGAALLQGFTALTSVRESYVLKKGDWILVHAIAGGLGLQYAQIAKLLGANVIGTTSTPEKAELAKQNGADHVILYSQQNVVEEVLRLTEGRGVNAVFDGVGKDTWEANFDLIARKGTIVSIGNASGAPPPFSVLKLGAKNITVLRPVMFNYIVTPEESEHYSTEYFSLLKQGVNIQIHKEYPFSADGVRQSQIDITGRGTTGKLLINFGTGSKL